MKSFEKNNKIKMLVVAVLMVTLALLMLGRSSKSVASFCESIERTDSSLSSSNGSTYSLSFLSSRSSDAGDIVGVLKNIEKSSPVEISGDVKILKQIFEKIDKDPSQALAASLSGIGPESSIKQFVRENCKI